MRVGCFLFAAVFLCSLASAQVPQTLHYQGYLASSGGTPVHGPVAMTFNLYDAASGGILLWTEAHPSVNVVNGHYQVVLGNSTPLGLELLGGPTWLGVAVGGEDLAPRQALHAVPYAYRAASALSAEDAMKLNGQSAAEFAAASHAHNWNDIDNVPIGIADGVDNDTTYSAGAGLTLIGTTLALTSCPSGQFLVSSGSGWACASAVPDFRLTPIAGVSPPCDASRVGGMYYDADEDALCICTSFGYVSVIQGAVCD